MLLHCGGGNGERWRACACEEKLGSPFIGGRARGEVCERCLDAQGCELRSGAWCARHTVVAGGNGRRGPGQGVGGRPRAGISMPPQGDLLGGSAEHDDGSTGAQPIGWGTQMPRGRQQYTDCRVA
jgi:hypothetical protein